MLKRLAAALLAALEFAAALVGVISLSGCTPGEKSGFPKPTSAPVEVQLTTESASPDATTAPEHTAELPSPTASPAPTEAPSPTATPEPTPTPDPMSLPSLMYKSRVNSLNVRAEANTQCEVLGSLGFEDPIPVIGREGEFYKVRYNGMIGYCYSKYLVLNSQKLYAYIPPWTEYKTDKDGNIVYEDDGVTPVVLHSELIDLRLFIPDMEVYQIFGTDENFTGQRLYTRPVPVMQFPTALKLAEAAKRFARDGYRIKLYDCYRPKSVQYILYDIVNDSRYIANPYNSASNHNRAAAVDITLIGPSGVEMEYPTPMHTFGKIVHRESEYMWTEEQRANVNYMTDIMLGCGFKLITTEWWHFSDEDYPAFVVMDINMQDIPMYTLDEIENMANLSGRGLNIAHDNDKINNGIIKHHLHGGPTQ